MEVNAGIRMRPAGFTLMELMAVMALIGLLSSLAVPGMSWVLQRAHVTASTNHLLGVLESTRYQSLAMQRAVTVCMSPDGLRCHAGQGHHLLVFNDANKDGALSGGEVQWSNEPFLQDDFWLVWRSFRGLPYLRWASGGRTDSLNGTFTLCNKSHRDELLRQLVVNRAGRVRLVIPAHASGAVLNSARRVCAG